MEHMEQVNQSSIDQTTPTEPKATGLTPEEIRLRCLGMVEKALTYDGSHLVLAEQLYRFVTEGKIPEACDPQRNKARQERLAALENEVKQLKEKVANLSGTLCECIQAGADPQRLKP